MRLNWKILLYIIVVFGMGISAHYADNLKEIILLSLGYVFGITVGILIKY